MFGSLASPPFMLFMSFMVYFRFPLSAFVSAFVFPFPLASCAAVRAFEEMLSPCGTGIFGNLARFWRRSRPAAACDWAETMPKPKKTAHRIFLDRTAAVFLKMLHQMKSQASPPCPAW